MFSHLSPSVIQHLFLPNFKRMKKLKKCDLVFTVLRDTLVRNVLSIETKCRANITQKCHEDDCCQHDPNHGDEMWTNCIHLLVRIGHLPIKSPMRMCFVLQARGKTGSERICRFRIIKHRFSQTIPLLVIWTL